MLSRDAGRLSLHSKGAIAKCVILRWIGLCGTIGVFVGIGWLLERIAYSQANAYDLVIVCALAAAGIFIRSACLFLATRFAHKAGAQAKSHLRKELFNAAHTMSTTCQAKISVAEMVQLAVEGVDHLEVYAGRYIPQLFYAIAAPITLFVCIVFIDLPTALALLVAAILLPLSLVAIQSMARRRSSGYWNRYTDLGAAFLENLLGLTTLKVFGSDEKRHRQMNENAERFRVATMRVLSMQLGSVSIMDILTFGGSAVGILVVATRFGSGAVGLGGCLIVMALAGEFLVPLRQLGSLFHIATTGMTTGRRIAQILDDVATLNNDNPQTLTVDYSSAPTITLSSLNYAYEDDRFALRDVNLKIGSGLSALVGVSGCGKSTLAQVIARLLVGYDGKVSIGDYDILNISSKDYASLVTLVSHNSYIFSGTVRDNLLLGKALASDDELKLALEHVGLLAEFGDGSSEAALDAQIKEGGSNLSGGQRQRLAIARGLLHDSLIYIFDEALSNIDPENEQAICALIHQLAKHKTVLLISHRLSVVTDANVIYCMSAGAIAESGSHQELLNLNGIYAQMYNEQHELEQLGRGNRL
ncbi:MAG: ATP-binding cassette domain-containing protein [Coriobacteriales bacterium]|jgi:ATP-binding cassette subfamily C protein|nr:ATP-binding cassette domain-containing protein [Coriobacteriales bacterium]